MPAIAVAVLAGNLVVQQLPRLPSRSWLLLAGVLGAAALVRRRSRLLGVAVAAFVVTVLAAQVRLADRLPPSMSGLDVPLHGWVDAFGAVDPERVVLSFRAAGALPAGVPRRMRLAWYDAPAGVRAGSSLSIVARLRPPHGFVNPDGFDYERWLYLNGYGATGYVRSGAIDAEARYGPAQAWLRLRERWWRRIRNAVPDEHAASLIAALTLGERSGFDAADWDALRRTGTSHLVAISGMHIGLLAMLAFAACRRLALRLPGPAAARDLPLAAAGAGAAALGYAALAGFTLPTQRALAMLLVALAVAVGRRRVCRFAGLGAALVAVLALDPAATLSPSFALSFGAVAALLAMASPRAAHRSAAPRHARVAALVKLQCGVTLALLPLAGAFFGQVSLIGVLVNLVAIPWFCFVLVPLALAGAGAAAVPLAGPALMRLAGGAASLTWAALAHAAAVPWAAVTLPDAPLPALLLGAVGTILALPAHRLPGRRLAWIALAPMFLASVPQPALGEARAVVFDVGHGLAVLVETAEHRLLYDTGARFRSGFDVGREIVVPAIRRRARGTLDLLIVSHADNDHAGGAPAVIAALSPPKRLIGPDVTAFGGRTCRRGQQWQWDGVAFEILHPPPGFESLGNESSCVLKVTASGGSMLIAGDIEARAEAALSRVPALRADVVVVPHHGSATSSSAAFVRGVQPSFAVVSAAYDSRWGFPKPQVSRRWRSAGAALLVTGDAGAVRIDLGAEGPAARGSRASRRRYWRSETNSFPGASTDSAL
jgi:competence protein ComEC